MSKDIGYLRPNTYKNVAFVAEAAADTVRMKKRKQKLIK